MAGAARHLSVALTAALLLAPATPRADEAGEGMPLFIPKKPPEKRSEGAPIKPLPRVAPAEERPLEKFQEWKGIESGVTKAALLVIRTEGRWDQLWRQHAKPLRPRPALPTVDFNRFMAVAIFAGERRIGSPAVVVRAVEEQGSRVIVRYADVQPPRIRGLAPSTDPFLQPYHIRIVPRRDLPVQFKKD